MPHRQLLVLTFIISFVLISVIANASDENVIFSENFESCIPTNWSVDNGVWECCLHNPPVPPGGGNFYVETVCGGSYPRYTDSRLISPEIDLTEIIVGLDEEVLLRFWQRFSYAGGDSGVVQIQVYDESTETWSVWDDISDRITASSSAWSPNNVDLTAYIGQKIKIAFYHTDNGDYNYSSGWSVDNVDVVLKTPNLTWDFECGWDDWSADNGLWEIGSPNAGPGKVYSGEKCVGTILNANYPRYTDSRLISPPFFLDCGETIRLVFRHWFSYAGGDSGVVQIQVYEESTDTWSVWDDISDPITASSSIWSAKNIDLTAYAGQKVKIAFYHTDNGDYNYSSGWYVDNIRIECDGSSLFPHFCECDIKQDGKCNILDYQRFIQDWGRTDCGTPSGSGLLPNDCECDLNRDGACNILDYQRFITDWGNSSCLVCE